MASLVAEGLDYGYEPGKPVLRGVSATIETGVLMGIVGPNGSGKSTLLNLMAGLMTPDSGAVRLDGTPIQRLRGKVRARRIAYLPQQVQPAYTLDVLEVLCLGRYPHAGFLGALSPHDLAVIEEVMAVTGTSAFRDRSFDTLSGGERQRVLLASILAQEPELLLLDEPTAALDLHHAAEVLTQLKSLVRRGYGVGLVTHDLNDAARYCDRLVLLGADRAVAGVGAPEDVFEAERLSAAYGATVRVDVDPIWGTPYVTADVSMSAPASK